MILIAVYYKSPLNLMAAVLSGTMELFCIFTKDKGVKMVVYRRIRELREDKDLTQTYMAHFLNVGQRTYSRYETGEHAIPLELLCKLADFHNVSVDYLLDRTDAKQPYPLKKKRP